jgi:hypothetical protein
VDTRQSIYKNSFNKKDKEMSNQRAYNRRKRSIKSVTIPIVYLEICDYRYEMAALLKQIDFWSGVTKDDEGWFYKTYQEWADELFIPVPTLRKLVSVLREKGFIETKFVKAGKTPKLHYRPVDDAIESAMGMNDDSATPQPPKSDEDSEVLQEITSPPDMIESITSEVSKSITSREVPKSITSTIYTDEVQKNTFTDAKKRECEDPMERVAEATRFKVAAMNGRNCKPDVLKEWAKLWDEMNRNTGVNHLNLIGFIRKGLYPTNEKFETVMLEWETVQQRLAKASQPIKPVERLNPLPVPTNQADYQKRLREAMGYPA